MKHDFLSYIVWQEHSRTGGAATQNRSQAFPVAPQLPTPSMLTSTIHADSPTIHADSPSTDLQIWLPASGRRWWREVSPNVEARPTTPPLSPCWLCFSTRGNSRSPGCWRQQAPMCPTTDQGSTASAEEESRQEGSIKKVLTVVGMGT